MTQSAFAGERIQAIPLPGTSEIANVRTSGSSLNGVPWMMDLNQESLTRYRSETANDVFNRSKPEDSAEYANFIRRAMLNDTYRGELAAYRMFEIVRDILATTFALGAFQNVNLRPDELPLITRPQTQQHFNVRYTGQDGGLRKAQWTTDNDMSHTLMRTIATDKVGYPLRDIQLGLISEVDKVNASLRYDMEMKLDSEAKDAIDDLEVNSGLRDLLTLHPSLVAANFPDKNHLDLTNTGTYGTAHKFTLARLKAVLAHVARLSVSELGPEGSLSIRSIVISPQNVEDQWDYVDLVSGFDTGTSQPGNTVPVPVRDQIFNTGTMNQAWGYKWATIPNARLDIGRMYVFMNKPIGWFFTKTAFDQVLRWEGVENQLANENYIALQRVIQFVTVEEWAHRIVIVDF
jgi:hypothetical protein